MASYQFLNTSVLKSKRFVGDLEPAPRNTCDMNHVSGDRNLVEAIRSYQIQKQDQSKGWGVTHYTTLYDVGCGPSSHLERAAVSEGCVGDPTADLRTGNHTVLLHRTCPAQPQPCDPFIYLYIGTTTVLFEVSVYS